MLSNSDCSAKNSADMFLDNLYGRYQIERVWASRSVNSNPNKRGKLTEILVHNYQDTKTTIQGKLLSIERNFTKRRSFALAINQKNGV